MSRILRHDLHLFFYCSDDLRDLHSFPTRRSTDLASFTTAGSARRRVRVARQCSPVAGHSAAPLLALLQWTVASDRKSTRLNSSHMSISYAVFCLKKKKEQYAATRDTVQHTTTASS